MPKELHATDAYRVESSQDMNPRSSGPSPMSGFARAALTVYDAGEECSDTLPKVGDLLTFHVDETGLLSLKKFTGLDLKMDPAPLRDLPEGLRVSPGYSFVTHAALERQAGSQQPPR